MRTFFDIVLGILATVLKVCLHGLVSTAGALAVFAGAAVFGVCLARRIARSKARSEKIAEVVSIDR